MAADTKTGKGVAQQRTLVATVVVCLVIIMGHRAMAGWIEQRFNPPKAAPIEASAPIIDPQTGASIQPDTKTQPITVTQGAPVSSALTSKPVKNITFSGVVCNPVPVAPETPTKFNRGDADIPAVALTFDDGPAVATTLKLLDVLAREQVKATFFVLGENAQKHPELVKAISDAGHTIANHSYSHPLHFADISVAEQTSELTDTTELLKNITGKTPRFFRPPGGSNNPALVELVNKMGMKTIMWSVDPKDYEQPGTDVVVERILGKGRVKNGAIILMHENKPQTLAAVPRIIKVLRERGFGFMTLDQMFNEKP
ncbi:MAG: polysaccharide deacetylase family protein [bacterium]